MTNVCPYAINVYDLNTERRIRRYVFRPEDIVSTTFIANIALDEGLTCDDTFAYFSDELGYGLIAYSWEQNKSWRFSHSYFMPDPLVGDFNIAGLNFQWGAEGIFGISASPMGADGFRTLYFSPLSSYTEFSVSTRILRDESKVTGSYKDFKVVGTRGRDTHTTAKVMDVTGVQLFNLIDQNAIGCWSTNFALKPQNIALVDKDDVGLVFPCDVKIDEGRNVWVISDRMPVFLESELNYGDINFRIYVGSLDKLIEGTVCETTPPPIRSNSLLSRPTLYNSDGVSQVPPEIFQSLPNRSPNLNSLFGTTNRPLPQTFNPQYSTTSRPLTLSSFNPQLSNSNRPMTQNINSQLGTSNRALTNSFNSQFGNSNRPVTSSFNSQLAPSRSLPFNTQIGTSSRSFGGQFGSSITSPNAVSRLYNPLLKTKQTSPAFTVTPSTSGITNIVNPWWLKDEDYQVVEK